MRRFLQLGLIAIAVFCHLAQAKESWTKHFLQEIEAIPADPSPEDIELLATLSTNDPNPAPAFSGSEVVKQRAWERLKQIDDYPARWARRITDERDRWKSGNGTPASYDNARSHTVQIMKRLKQPGMVTVFGSLLDDWEWPGWQGDPRKRNPFEGSSDAPFPYPNGMLAARALAELIEQAPVQKDEGNYDFDDIATWQLWYAQVKAGKRSFRIKGDPAEYRLEGSRAVAVTTGPTPSKSASSPAAVESFPPSEASPLRLGLIVAACGILGLAVFAVVRAKRRG